MRARLLAGLVLLAALAGFAAGPALGQHEQAFIVAEYPGENETINLTAPTIRVRFQGPIDPGSVYMEVDGLEVSDLEESFGSNATHAWYEVPEIFALDDGPHNVTVTVQDASVQDHRLDWMFHVDTTPPAKEKLGISFQAVVILLLAFVLVVILVMVGVYIYFRKTRRFTFKKFFARYPLHRNLLTLYVPLVLAVIGTLVALYYLSTLAGRPRFAYEFLILGGFFVAFAPYAMDVRHLKAKTRAYERAYSQFLFEMADAMRGGIDPMKCVFELAKTETGMLGKPLRVAADGLRLGRPFDQVMVTMAKRMRSSLIERYAALVGEAARVGGEIASVVHRAAKDMDEMVKVNIERSRQMKTPMVTMYIAFGVLMLMVSSLMDFAPSLTEIDAGDLGLFGGGADVPKMDLATMQLRFFHLTLITSLGTGLLIGSFTEGRLRHGMLHAFVMVTVAALYFRFVIVG